MKFRTQAICYWIIASGVIWSGCFRADQKPTGEGRQVATSVNRSELESLMQERGLTEADLLAAAKTFVPSGSRDDYIGVMGLGVGGRVATFAVPSMRLLKIVGMFTPEPWQGYAYDDQSKAILHAGGRDEIDYHFGESGLPAYSRTKGEIDGHTAFVADGTHGRIGLITLDDFEAKQIVVNPYFRSSHVDIAVTPGTEYVVQMSEAPEVPAFSGMLGSQQEDSQQAAFRGGATFWYVKRETTASGFVHDSISAKGSFTVELPPYIQGRPVVSAGAGEPLVFSLAACEGKSWLDIQEHCGGDQGNSILHVINWQKLAETASEQTSNGEPVWVPVSEAVASGALFQIRLPAGASSFALSPNGERAIVTMQYHSTIEVLDLSKLSAMDRQETETDAFGVPTFKFGDLRMAAIDVGGPSVEAAFASDNIAYLTALEPGRLLRLNLEKTEVANSVELGFDGTHISIVEDDKAGLLGKYAIVLNPNASGRFLSVGPMLPMNPHLYDVSGDEMVYLTEMAVPQATRIGAVAVNASKIHTVRNYPIGTDTRTGKFSPFRTLSGQERIVREGNRVHVFGTVIRSHINPEIIEVNEGDIVSIHLTNLEQSHDQTHGFTVSTYNVHGSWEPGKTASVTFTADRVGAFPYYCTEFCSALHLEMQGYLIVRPKGLAALDINTDTTMSTQ